MQIIEVMGTKWKESDGFRTGLTFRLNECDSLRFYRRFWYLEWVVLTAPIWPKQS